MISIERYHDICMGHRVYGHENKCGHLHGHNYRFTFTISSKDGLDYIGRVVDFSVIKETLCAWLEEYWDHKMLIWKDDPIRIPLAANDPKGLVVTTFNPTAENIAHNFLHHIGPSLLQDKDVWLMAVRVEETRKCSAIATL